MASRSCLPSAIGAKVPDDVIVQIDPSRHNGHVAEVVSGGRRNMRVFRVRLNSNDLATLHYDQHIVQSMALAIKQHSGADHHGLRLYIWLSLRACK